MRYGFNDLIRTSDDRVQTAIRLMTGLVFFPHGAQKVFGWFGGPGFSGTMDSFTQQLGIPPVLAFLAIAAEFLGSICLIFGFLSRVAAFAIAVNMGVAIFVVHLNVGFFMNWMGTQAGEGFEYHLLALALLSSVMIRGAGALSIDRTLTERESARGRTAEIRPFSRSA